MHPQWPGPVPARGRDWLKLPRATGRPQSECSPLYRVFTEPSCLRPVLGDTVVTSPDLSGHCELTFVLPVF